MPLKVIQGELFMPNHDGLFRFNSPEFKEARRRWFRDPRLPFLDTSTGREIPGRLIDYQKEREELKKSLKVIRGGKE